MMLGQASLSFRDRSQAWIGTAYLIVLGIILAFSAWIYNEELESQRLTFHEGAPSVSEYAGNGGDSGNIFRFESNGILFYLAKEWVTLSYPGGLCSLYDERFCQRIVSLVSSLLAVAAMFCLGTLLKGRGLGLLCAFALASNVRFIGDAAHGRFFALNHLCVIAATCALVWFCRRADWRGWLAYTLSMAACLASMVLSLFIVPIHAVMAFYLAERRRRVFLFLGMTVLLLGAEFLMLSFRDPSACERQSRHTALLGSAWTVRFENDRERFSDAFLLFIQNGYFDRVPELSLGINWRPEIRNLFSAMLLWGAAYYGWRSWRGRRLHMILAVLLTMLAVIAFMVLVSLSFAFICSAEYVNFLIPFGALFLAYAMRSCRWGRQVFLAFLLTLLPLYAIQTLVFGWGTDDQYRFIFAERRPGDLVLMSQSQVNLPPFLLNSPVFPSWQRVFPAADTDECCCFDAIRRYPDRLPVCNHWRLYRALRKLPILELPGSRVWIACPDECGYVLEESQKQLGMGRYKIWKQAMAAGSGICVYLLEDRDRAGRMY